MFNLNDDNLTDLSMNYDPAPLLMAFSSIPSGNFLTMPQPEGVAAGPGESYESIIGGFPTEAPAGPRKPTAPLGQEALRLLAFMNPAKDPRAPAVAPGRFGQIGLQPLASGQRGVPPSLAQILGR